MFNISMKQPVILFWFPVTDFVIHTHVIEYVS